MSLVGLVFMQVLYPGGTGIWSVGFCAGRKTGEHGEKPSEQDESQQHKLNPHVKAGSRTRALSPIHHPMNPLCLKTDFVSR